MSEAKETIGFVGIGAMGTPMAGHLARAGYSLIVYDLDASRTSAFAAARPCRVAANLDELGQAADIVITMLPDGNIVRRVLCGAKDSFRDCVAGKLKRGAIVIEIGRAHV